MGRDIRVILDIAQGILYKKDAFFPLILTVLTPPAPQVIAG